MLVAGRVISEHSVQMLVVDLDEFCDLRVRSKRHPSLEKQAFRVSVLFK